MKVTKVCALGASSNSGDNRATMNTPAVTMVAAWISAETASGLPWRRAARCAAGTARIFHRAREQQQTNERESVGLPAEEQMVLPVSDGACAKMVSRSTAPTIMNSANMPSAKPKSPTRLTTKALIAAALASGL